jgi:hypothetical protein
VEPIVKALTYFAADYKKMISGLQLRINEKFKAVVNQLDGYFQDAI